MNMLYNYLITGMIVLGMEFRRDGTMHDKISVSIYTHGDGSMGAAVDGTNHGL